MEEWNSIPLDLIHNLCKNYLYRINKVLELNCSRLEPEHLKKEKHGDYNWEKCEDIPKIHMVYNDKVLGIQREREIKKYKGEIKAIKKKFNEEKNNFIKPKKRDLKNISIGRALSIINGPKIKNWKKIRELKN